MAVKISPAVGVIGGGIMGTGIAEACLSAGAETLLVEVDQNARKRAWGCIDTSLDRAARHHESEAPDKAETLGRLTITDDLASLDDRDLVVEAVPEDIELKLDVFRELDRIVQKPDAVLASNTSSIPITKLAIATTRPQQVVGLHFVNPVPVRPLVELVPSLLTSERTVDVVRHFVVDVLGKQVITSKDRAGFIINALLIPFVLSAIRMLESGFASEKDIDTSMTQGCAHPIGPLAVADLVGLDTTLAIANSLYQELKEPQHIPPPLLLRMVEAGFLGRKSGKGFFDYPDEIETANLT